MNTALTRSFLLVIVAVCLTLTLPATAQDGGNGGGAGGGGNRGGDRGGDIRQRWEEMSEEDRNALIKRMEERRAEFEKQQATELQERLKMTPEDYDAISPLITKIRNLSRERDAAFRSSGRGGFGGGGGGFGGFADRGGSGFGPEQSESSKSASEALAELRQAIEDKNTGDIKNALIKLRKARTAIDTALKEAREELRGVCTPLWEAEFVVMGLLD